MNIRIGSGMVLLSLLGAVDRDARAQGPITPGATMTGTISLAAEVDTWTLTANAGDAIIVRMGEIVGGSGLTPWLRIYSPSSALLDGASGASTAEVAVNASVAGTYTVVVTDYYGTLGGIGDYRLTLAETGHAVTISPGDEGGPMTNGATQTGTLGIGDLDTWTVDANAGDAIIVRMGEIVAGSGIVPWLRIYSPTGTYMDGASGAAAAEVAINASITGTYVVVATDYYGNATSVGDYRLTLAESGHALTITPGDEGGPLTGGLVHGFIDIGDIDAWTVDALAGQAIVVTIMEEAAAGSSLTPWLRIYSPTGTYLDGSSGAATAQVAITAPATGTYLVVACDYYGPGTGPYQTIPNNAVGVDDALRPHVLAFARCAPNPFVTRTVLHYSVPRDGAVSVRLFDAQGRLVRTLVDEASQPAGENEAVWDGRNTAGSMARPGIYLAQLNAGGRSLVQRLVLTR